MASGVAGEGDVGLAGFGFVCWLRDIGIRRVVGVLSQKTFVGVGAAGFIRLFKIVVCCR